MRFRPTTCNQLPPPKKKKEYHFQPDIMPETAETNAGPGNITFFVWNIHSLKLILNLAILCDPLKIPKRWRSLNLWKGHLTIPKGSLWITWCFYNFRSVLILLTFFNPFFGYDPTSFQIYILSPEKKKTHTHTHTHQASPIGFCTGIL